jgi:hypothetical protein
MTPQDTFASEKGIFFHFRPFCPMPEKQRFSLVIYLEKESGGWGGN